MVLGVLENLLSDCLVYIIVQTLMNKAPVNEFMYLWYRIPLMSGIKHL